MRFLFLLPCFLFFCTTSVLSCAHALINCLFRLLLLVVFVEKTVSDSILFVCDDGVELHVFYALKDTLFNVGVTLFKLSNKQFCFLPFRVILPVVARRASVGKPARALDKVQIVVISPRLYIILSYQIKRANKFHSLKICTV